MKNNKTNLEKQIKKRTKINPPHLKEFLEELLPAYIKKLKNIDIISIADRVFSEYIRLSNATDEWRVQCVTCWERFDRTKIQNGHYRTRACRKYRFNTKNCAPQCLKCNCILNGNYRNYYLRMVNTYGEETERKLRTDKDTTKLYDYDLIENCVERYKTVKEKINIISKNTTKQ